VNCFYKIKFILFFILFISKTAISSETSSTEILLGISMLNFGYKEFNSNDIELDQEDGTIPGISFAITHQSQQWLSDFKLTYHKGLVDYIGQTQTGIPVTSRTDTRYLDYSLSFGKWLKLDNLPRFAVFAGFGQHSWQRNIRSTTTNTGAAVSGLNEKYYWDYLLIGTKLEIISSPKNLWTFDIQYNHMMNAKIDVEFNGFDPATLNLGNQLGLRLASPYQYQIKDQLSIRIEPYYEYWQIALGEPQQLLINGTVSGTSIVEPRSETQNIGFNLSLVKIF